MKCLLNIGPLITSPKQSETRATRNNLHFSCSCWKNVSIPDMWQSKTLEEQSMKAGQKSLQPVFSIASCRQSGDKWQSKTLFFTIFSLSLSIILTFLIAAYPVRYRCTLHDVTVDIFCIQLNEIIRTTYAWKEGIKQWRYYILFPMLTFAKPSCDNVLQPSLLRGSGSNTVSHSGLANVNIRKRMFYPLINLS